MGDFVDRRGSEDMSELAPPGPGGLMGAASPEFQGGNDGQPVTLGGLQQSATPSVENYDDDEEDGEQRATRFVSPASNGSPIRGNGPIPPAGGYDDDGDNLATEPSSSGTA